MATDEIECSALDPQTITSWLEQYGSHVTRILLDNHCQEEDPRESWKHLYETPSKCSAPLLSTLPCSNLLQLSLCDWSVKLSNGYQGVFLQAATGLTRLALHMGIREDFKNFDYDVRNQAEENEDHLHYPSWDDSGHECFESLAALCDLPFLERLDLSVQEVSKRRASAYSIGWSADDRLTSKTMGCWSTNLQWLSISGVLALDSFEAFSPFTKLQHLDLNLRLGVWTGDWDDAETVQQGLLFQLKQLQELTYLSICIEKRKDLGMPDRIMGHTLSGCSGLQELYLYSPTIEVSAFQGLTGLRTLHLVADAVFEGAATGVAAVFSHIGCMQQLERLVLAGGFLGTTVTLSDADAELCGGLTASVHLTHLDLSGLELPRSAWLHLFPAGRQLPQLPESRLVFVDERRYLLDGCALAQMAACCPAIPRLGLKYMSLFKPDMSLVPLLGLRQLVDLECHCVTDCDASVGVLACMTLLTRLHMRASEGLTDAGLLQLTALTGLQELTVDGERAHYRNMPSILSGDWRHAITIKATCSPRPDVWYQLLLACVPVPQCQEAINKQLPGIMQQLQDSGHGTTAFELAREVGRARARQAEAEAEAKAVLREAHAAVTQAQKQLQEQVEIAGLPCEIVSQGRVFVGCSGYDYFWMHSDAP